MLLISTEIEIKPPLSSSVYSLQHQLHPWYIPDIAIATSTATATDTDTYLFKYACMRECVCLGRLNTYTHTYICM